MYYVLYLHICNLLCTLITITQFLNLVSLSFILLKGAPGFPSQNDFKTPKTCLYINQNMCKAFYNNLFTY